MTNFIFDNFTLDELFEKIRYKLDIAQKRISYLEKENKELKNEHYKNNKLQEMKQKLEEMEDAYYHRGFPISKEEEENIQKWIHQHENEYHSPRKTPFGTYRGGAIGGCYTYTFTPTSIGTVGTIKCSCGKEYTFMEL